MKVQDIRPELIRRWTWKQLQSTYIYVGMMVYQQHDNLGMLIAEEPFLFVSPLAIIEELFYERNVN